VCSLLEKFWFLDKKTDHDYAGLHFRQVAAIFVIVIVCDIMVRRSVLCRSFCPVRRTSWPAVAYTIHRTAARVNGILAIQSNIPKCKINITKLA
jgi:hypothetical protein